MTGKRAARQYARALFDVASRAGRVDVVGSDLSVLTGVIAGNPELGRLFETPSVPAKNKGAVIEAVIAAAGPIADEVRRLVTLLAGRDRLALLGDVASAFSAVSLEAGHVIPAEIVTAVPLTDGGKSALARALGKAIGRDVTISERVDPAIIGGLVATVGSVVFDGSVVRQVERIRTKLLAGA